MGRPGAATFRVDGAAPYRVGGGGIEGLVMGCIPSARRRRDCTRSRADGKGGRSPWAHAITVRERPV